MILILHKGPAQTVLFQTDWYSRPKEIDAQPKIIMTIIKTQTPPPLHPAHPGDP